MQSIEHVYFLCLNYAFVTALYSHLVVISVITVFKGIYSEGLNFEAYLFLSAQTLKKLRLGTMGPGFPLETDCKMYVQ